MRGRAMAIALALVAVSLLFLAHPSEAGATDRLFSLGSAITSCVTPNTLEPAWNTPACWSLTDDGVLNPGGGNTPTSTNDVQFDTFSGGFNGLSTDSEHRVTVAGAVAHDIILTGTGMTHVLDIDGISLSDHATLTVHSLYVTAPLPVEVDIRPVSGGPGTGTFYYTGTVDGSSSAITTMVGSHNSLAQDYQYIGPNGFGTMSNVGIFQARAVGKPIYCYPGCLDRGSNLNFVFAAPPAGPPSVTTLPADNIGGTAANLKGSLDSMGLIRPTLTNGPNVSASTTSTVTFSMLVDSTANLMIFETASGFQCGSLLNLTVNGLRATLRTDSSNTEASDGPGTDVAHVELWYMVVPPRGSVTVQGVWSSACTTDWTHVIGAFAFSGVDTGNPISTGTSHLQKSGGTPVATVTLSFTAPGPGQSLAFTIATSKANDLADVRLNNPSGLATKWGFLVAGVGTTYCGTSNLGCGAGGIALGGAFSATVFAGSAYYAASETLINGLSLPSAFVFFQWGLSSSALTSSTPQTIQTSTGPFSFLLATLSSGTTYYFQACATGQITICGVMLSFMTSRAIGLDWWPLFVFVAVIILSLRGAWWIKEKRGT